MPSHIAKYSRRHSRCSDYVRHLIKVNSEKQAAVEQAKKDLAAKQEKIEEEKRTQQDPSEPESTTSSLTISSRSDGGEKKKAPGQEIGGDSGKKSRRFESHESTVSSGSSSEGAKQALPSLSLGATSTVSDITDSNKGGSCSKESFKNEKDKADDLQESDETVSSEAAVASKVDTRSSCRRHKDVVVAVSSKSDSVPSRGTSTTSEKTSLDSDFQLDYQEVFLKSNVPQLLASTNGRIVSFNDFFLKVSGLSRKEVECLTIFSLVQTALLSNLFEIVAAALRSNDSESTDNDAGECKEDQESEGQRKMAPLKDYSAITLPCVDFSTIFREEYSLQRPRNEKPLRQLYMTVTLMTDSDIRKRCFHCAFTDSPPLTNGLASVTPELLSTLFANPATSSTPTRSKEERDLKDLDEDEDEQETDK